MAKLILWIGPNAWLFQCCVSASGLFSMKKKIGDFFTKLFCIKIADVLLSLFFGFHQGSPRSAHILLQFSQACWLRLWRACAILEAEPQARIVLVFQLPSPFLFQQGCIPDSNGFSRWVQVLWYLFLLETDFMHLLSSEGFLCWKKHHHLSQTHEHL